MNCCQSPKETRLITPIMKVAIVNDNGLTVSGLVSSFDLLVINTVVALVLGGAVESCSGLRFCRLLGTETKTR